MACCVASTTPPQSANSRTPILFLDIRRGATFRITVEKRARIRSRTYAYREDVGAAPLPLFSESPTKDFLGNWYPSARMFMRVSCMNASVSLACHISQGGSATQMDSYSPMPIVLLLVACAILLRIVTPVPSRACKAGLQYF
jgi:CRISPR/Cas system CMR subunit Cmr6 (Cas7 group RAMP superfamily)